MSTKDTLELLEEFRTTGQQAPFEEIARRYAGMVYNVAVQVTKDAHDAEDATQATFLTLAVHAKTDSSIRYLGPWLRKVSHRLALDIRRSKKRRKAREEKHASGDDRFLNGYNVPVSKDMQQEELRAILRDELEKLPAKYRMPLVLYYFGGLTPEEMGKELKVNTSTLGVRLHRGRKLLADSLSGRGISINTAALSVLLAALVDQFAQQHLVRISTSAAFHAGAIFAYSGQAPMQVGSLLAATRSAISYARLKMILSVAIVVTSTLAGGAEILKKLDLLPTNLLKVHFTDWLRPVFDKLHFSKPSALLTPSTSDAKTPVRQRFATVECFTLIQNAGFSVSVAAESDRQALASEGLIGFNVQPPHATPLPAFRTMAENAANIASAQQFKVFSIQSASKVAKTYSPRSSFAAGAADSFVIDSVAGNASQTLTGGLLRTSRLIVGDTADGSFNQIDGELRATDGITLGRGATGVGKYILDGGTVLAANITVGDAGHGVFTQNGGGVAGIAAGRSVKTLSLGDQASGVGEYDLNGGTLAVDRLIIGNAGAGTFSQTGGTARLAQGILGNAITGSGTWSISGGSIRLASAADGKSSGIVVGNEGLGSLLVRPKSNGVAISETDTNIHAGLTVRANAGADGILRGWGNIGLTGTVVQNGRVVADGGGTHHLLDLSSVAGIVNTIDNATDGGANGWYARGGGELKLPPVKLANGVAATWGEDSTDPLIDLVNSVRFVPHGLTTITGASLTLLDAHDTDAPKMPIDARALSIYEIDSSASAATIDWTFRVDDAQAAFWGMDESKLSILFYTNGWQSLDPDSITHDLLNHLVGGTTIGLPKFIAVGVPVDITFGSAPEPGSLLIGTMALTGVSLLRRRRRV